MINNMEMESILGKMAMFISVTGAVAKDMERAEWSGRMATFTREVGKTT